MSYLGASIAYFWRMSFSRKGEAAGLNFSDVLVTLEAQMKINLSLFEVFAFFDILNVFLQSWL